MYVFKLKCPYCGNEMLYSSKTRFIKGKRKRCVYCGKSFEVSSAVVKDLNAINTKMRETK